MGNKNPTSRTALKVVILSVLFVFVLASLFFVGSYILRNNQMRKVDKVLGVDVSAYQGEIDWPTIERQGIYFAYIKATEGTDYVDDRFEANWSGIDSTSIAKGAYLFYDFSADGQKMADLFIKTVPKERVTLPPVIDIEMSDETKHNPPDKKVLIDNVNKLVKALTEAYGKNPIIYTNVNTYQTFFTDQFPDLKFWIVDINSDQPEIEGHDWTFWQYTWRGILNGTDGGSTAFIDLDLYNGNLEEFTKEFSPTFLDGI